MFGTVVYLFIFLPILPLQDVIVLHATPTLTPAKYLSTPVDKYFAAVTLLGHGRLQCADRLPVLIPWQFFLAILRLKHVWVNTPAINTKFVFIAVFAVLIACHNNKSDEYT